MRFHLWGPNASAIVRIYIQGTDSYISRRRNGPLELSPDDWMTPKKVQGFLTDFDIDLSAHGTRRSLAWALDSKHLLVGDVDSYRSYFSSREGWGVNQAAGGRSKVIVLDDFLHRRTK